MTVKTENRYKKAFRIGFDAESFFSGASGALSQRPMPRMEEAI